MADNEWTQEWNDLEDGIHPQDPQDYDFLIQLWRNLRKRARVAASTCNNWPLGNEVAASFQITSATTDGTTITLTGNASAPNAWTGAALFIDGLSVKRWVAWGGGAFDGSTPPSYPPYNYADYDVVADADNEDHTMVLSGQITNTPTATTMSIPDDGNWTLNRTLASLVGTRAEIIGRGKLTWAERWPEKPVRVRRIVTPTTSAADYVEQDGAGWPVDSLNDCDLIGIVGGKIKRIPITSNTATRINFPSQSSAPTGTLFAIPENSYWPSSRATASAATATFQSGRMFQWYRGLKRGTYTHRSDDSLDTEDMLAEPTQAHPGGGYDAAIDRDLIYTGFVDGVDTVVSPDMHKCLRGLQADIETMIGFYILQWNLVDADHASNMVQGNMASAMNAIGGNYQERTIASVGGGYATFSGSITMPDGVTTQSAFLVRFGTNGFYLDSAIAAVESDKLVSGLMGGLNAGETVGVSFGFPRAFQRRVQRVYPRIIFKPSLLYDVFSDTYSPVQPPTAANPGEYVTFAPDTLTSTYYDELYPPTDVVCGHLASAGKAFSTNTKARYVGHNAPDPTTFITSSDTHSEEYALKDFDDYKCVVNSTGGGQWLAPTMQGTVTAATSTSITDDGADLWVNATPRITHTGTCNGTSSEAIVEDTTKSADGFWLSMSGKRFEGMVVEVEGSPGVWTKRFIVAQSGTQLSPHTAYSFNTSGKTYRIREPGGASGTTGPGILNYWKGATLRVTKAADGSTVDFVVTGHDDTTLFFSPGSYTPVAGDAWEIIFLRVGQTLTWSGSEWSQSDSEDANNAVQPDTATQFGRLTKGDYWTYPNVNLLVQMKKLIDLMRYTGSQPSWTANGENNHKGDFSGMGSPVTWRGGGTTVEALASAAYSAASPVSSNAAPYTMYSESITWDIPQALGNIFKRYAYLSVSPMLCDRFGITSRRVQVWGYMTIDGADNPQGYSDYTNGPGCSVKGYREIGTLGGSGATPQYHKWTKLYSADAGATTIDILVGDNTLTPPTVPSVVPEITDLTLTCPSYNGKVEQTYKGAYVLEKFAVVDWQPFFDSA